MGSKNYWSASEMIVCLAIYSTLATNQRKSPPAHVTKKLSDLIGRTQSSIELRFANFSHHDPQVQELGLKGRSGGGAKVAEWWNKFALNDGNLNSKAIMEWMAYSYFHEMTKQSLAASNEQNRGDLDG